MSSSRRAAGVAILVTLAGLYSSACTEQPKPIPPTHSPSALPAQQFPNYPAEANEFRFHWSAARGNDLETGPAVALRAYIESVRLAAFAGGDSSVVYPGFMLATPQNAGPATQRDDLFQSQYVRPETRAEYEADGLKFVARQVYGYQPTHILNLVPMGDGYRATVCLGAYSVYRAEDNDPGKFFSTTADPETGQPSYPDGRSNVQIWRVELTDKDPRVGNSPQASVGPQAGPQPAPTDDVFGRWFITGSSATGLWGPVGDSEDIDTPEVRKQCEDAMPDDAATRTAMAAGFHSQPPPHGVPIPGWPAANK